MARKAFTWRHRWRPSALRTTISRPGTPEACATEEHAWLWPGACVFSQPWGLPYERWQAKQERLGRFFGLGLWPDGPVDGH